ncbi:MAG: glycosyltransferase, partial [Gammaproteobacteria bacterium]|nr:glycosyltransferase [Gammaproteobacteria bacterium]
MDKTDLLKRTIWNRQTVADLRQLIETERPDVMHCHNIFPLISPSAYDVARDMNVPVVQTLHNYRLVCPKATLLREGRICEDCLGKLLAWPAVVHACYRDSRSASAAVTGMLAYHWQRGTWKKAVDRYVAPSQFLKQKLVEGGFPEDAISVKPHFVAHDPGTGAGSGNYALYVGRLSPEKGVQCLLDAWALLPDQLELKFLGDGPLADTVAAAASANARIEWLGHQPAATVHTMMKEAKFLIVPSIWYEPFGLCVIESFANGTP